MPGLQRPILSLRGPIPGSRGPIWGLRGAFENKVGENSPILFQGGGLSLVILPPSPELWLRAADRVCQNVG